MVAGCDSGVDEALFNCTRYAVKRDFSLQKRLESHFVRCIQGDAARSGLLGGLIGQAQAGKTLKVWLFKLQMAQCGEVKS